MASNLYFRSKTLILFVVGAILAGAWRSSAARSDVGDAAIWALSMLFKKPTHESNARNLVATRCKSFTLAQSLPAVH